MSYSMRPRKPVQFLATSDPDEDDVGPSRKKSKNKSKTATATGLGSRKGKRARVGKLKNLPEMPLDILFEIFSLLRPLDLLHLAWTTKDLRAVLMRRSAIWVWKLSLGAVESLPPCPPDLNEVQWTHLVFYPHCHFCDAANIKTVNWACRLRTCNKCLNDITHFRPSDRFAKIALGMTPSYVDYITIAPIIEDPHTRRRSYNVFVPQMAREKLQQESRERCKTLESIVPFIAERKALKTRLEEHAKLCDEYLATVNYARSEELDEKRDKRCDSIVSRLRDLGWASEIDRLPEHSGHHSVPDMTWITNHTLVKKPQLLTEKIWKNIAAPLEELMQYIRTRNLLAYHPQLMEARQKVFKDLVDSFIESRSPLEFLPSPAEFASMSIFQTILESPVDVEVTKASFLEPESSLSEFVEEWRQSTTQYLVELTPDASKTSQLSLATTLFNCEQCCQPISYPRILAHRCMMQPLPKIKGQRLCSWRLGGEPWNFGGGKITFAGPASEAARHFVVISGGNPKKMTATEMDTKDSRFECLRCANDKERPIMTWRRAISHALDNRRQLLPDDWKCLDEKQTKIARDQHRKQFLETLTRPVSIFGNLHCLHCRQKYKVYSDLGKHLFEAHGKDGSTVFDTLGKDWCTDLDAPPFGPTSILAMPV